MNLEDFIKEVDKISTEIYCLTYTEMNGKDCEALTTAHNDGDTPQEFIEWWVEKYDLNTRKEFTEMPSILKKLPNELK